jgi:hypothetical protein
MASLSIGSTFLKVMRFNTMATNSSDLFEIIRTISTKAGDNVPIDIQHLAASANLSVPALISVLTELEQRDEIIVEITTSTDPAGDLVYDGTVRLMERPPDEIQKTTGL